MERTIKRTVTATLCLGQRLNALGEFEDFVKHAKLVASTDPNFEKEN